MSNKDTDLSEINSLLDSLDESSAYVSYSSPEQEFNNELYISEDGIDPRLKMLSHSSNSTLHKCPRKFQLYRMNSLAQEETENVFGQLTLDFGTVVGHGIQRIFEDIPLDTIILEMFLMWSVDIEIRDNKRSKSLPEAILAVQQFHHLRNNSDYLADYELLYTENGKPAVELAFKILLPEGFSYRGFIDVVLRHKETGEILVVEDKTTWYREINPAQYKNSGQALGYSVILDHLVPGLSSYTVLYLVYGTTLKEFNELPFEKSSLQRAEWLTQTLMDTQLIQMYESYGLYPKNGDFCYDFYRECPYFGLCSLDTANLIKPLTVAEWEKIQKKEEVYEFVFDFHELVSTQINKVGG